MKNLKTEERGELSQGQETTDNRKTKGKPISEKEIKEIKETERKRITESTD